MDVNAYTSKKTMSQGLFDMTLFTRNATLLKHLMDQGSDKTSYFYFLLPLITTALIVQVLIYASEASYKKIVIFPGGFRCFAIDHGQMELQSKGRKSQVEQIEQYFIHFSVHHFSFECYYQHFCYS